MNNKKILICGFGRSGTTYLYLQMYKNDKKSLNEPLHPALGLLIKSAIKRELSMGNIHRHFTKKDIQLLFYNYYEFFGENIFKIIKKYHPNRDGIYHLIYNVKQLWMYLRYFKEFNIKEGLLLYVDEKIIRKYWEPFLIIRHPIDVFISSIKGFLPTTKIYTFYKLFSRIHWIFRYFINRNIKFNYLYLARELYYFYGIEKPIKELESMSIEEAFIISWTIANYYAVKSLPKNKIIIYEKPETYKRLPFELKDPLKIKIYPKAREDLSYKFEKIAKKWDLDSEYNYLLKLFD